MNHEEQWARIVELRSVAEAHVINCADNAEQLVRSLRGGVTVTTAYQLIKDHFGDPQSAQRVMTELSAVFPKSNGSILMCMPLSQENMNVFYGDMSAARDYFETIHGYIVELVEALTEKMGQVDPTDAAAVDRFNDFRRNAVSYISYVDSMFYEVRDILLKDAVASWEDLLLKAPVVCVENGDYLFADGFVETLKKTQRQYVGNELSLETESRYTLADVEWLTKKTRPHMVLPFLFATYLNSFIAE